jgi:hypothetical protein
MRKLFSAIGVAALAAAGLGLGTGAAQAAPHNHCQLDYTVSPASYHSDAHTVSLGTTSTTLTFNVVYLDDHGLSCGTVTDWQMLVGNDVPGPWDSSDRNLYAHLSYETPVTTINPSGLDNSDAGDRFNVEFIAQVKDTHGNTHFLTQTCDEGLDVKRATRWSGYNAFPEPVLKGDQVHEHGSLYRASWNSLGWYVYTDRKVSAESHIVGGPYVVDGGAAIYTDSEGYASASQEADQTRTHRFAYFGNSTAGASHSSSDSVAVTS